ncbi:cell division protein FtsZ [Pectinatus haikarae]|uniref:Cell division protein FtsZ n=1 Tax=Pectinatus haikarae TaxID=349096 RepID=A0ABT9Y5K7_9FIRM|nr:cell division protein FtsZ [Pectinatus haikarae]MDQ0203118.1 cell division protein FtsZ [Pectinatus haikarae]
MQREDIRGTIVNIKIIGIGGGGNSVLKRIADEEHSGMDLIAVNTDKKQLQTLAQKSISLFQIGENVTRGLGSGGKVALGQTAAVNDESLIRDSLTGADMIFITAGMGGGTGTGAAPVIAEIAHSMGILTIGVFTIPFSFEGSRKRKTAMAGVEAMRPFLDALIVIQNDKLLELHGTNKHMSLLNAFHMVDSVLKQAIRCVSELILTVGVINVDFADVKSIFKQNGNSEALLGIGEGSGAVNAVKMAVESPLIERSVNGARGIVLNITGDETLSLFEVNEATKFIYENTSSDVNIILGTVIDKSLAGKVRATIIATDFVDDKIAAPAKKEEAASENPSSAPDLPVFMQKTDSTAGSDKNLGRLIFDIEKIDKKKDI